MGADLRADSLREGRRRAGKADLRRDGAAAARRRLRRNHCRRPLHRYLRNIQRHAAESVPSRSENLRGQQLLRRRHAEKPRPRAGSNENVPYRRAVISLTKSSGVLKIILRTPELFTPLFDER